jgi:hypothetical protein
LPVWQYVACNSDVIKWPLGLAVMRCKPKSGIKRPYGDQRKIAARLALNVDAGDTFTMRDLR